MLRVFIAILYEALAGIWGMRHRDGIQLHTPEVVFPGSGYRRLGVASNIRIGLARPFSEPLVKALEVEH